MQSKPSFVFMCYFTGGGGKYGGSLPNLIIYGVCQKKFRLLEGCGIKSMRPIFKTKVIIYHSKANLDEKILFGKIKHL